MRSLDFSSWQSLLATLIGLALLTLISIGILAALTATVLLVAGGDDDNSDSN